MELIKAELYLKNGNVIAVITTEESLRFAESQNWEHGIDAYEKVTHPDAQITRDDSGMMALTIKDAVFEKTGYVQLSEKPDAVTVYKLF